ncbi:MAG: hypothetical protein DME19_14495 [Verrucomicrobia bacterium]|nr:MAG: hypothetical protein DME19_14495 [Verrucomicrobiota bacterium]
MLDSPRLSRYKCAVRRRGFALVLVFLVFAGLVGCWRYCQWREHRFDAVILAAATHYGVEPALVKAVVWRESWFNPNARGSRQEFGLMQIREAAAVLDPATNTLAGAWYLARLLRRYQKTDSPIPYALADYNAGRGNVLRWTKATAATNSAAFIEQMDFPGTRKYIRSVVSRYDHYRPRVPAQNP